jgi:UDP-N-acetylmuramoyl-tripeptide--D-alanyl-D-alanine ligase
LAVKGISVRDVLQALGQSLASFQPSKAVERGFRQVVVDSRVAGPDSLFVALKGERADGHDYVADAVARGASGIVVQRPVELAGKEMPTVFLVRDSLAALQALASYWRGRHRVEVIGVTGSVGKSSTKELIAALLASRFRVLKSEGNLNTEIGLPLTLLQLDDSIEQAVLEMGMYAPGEIRQLCQIARPRVGVVTNVGASHMERLGSLEAIAKAKAELVECLPRDGIAVLNGDDRLVRAMASRSAASVLLYGLDPAFDLWAGRIEGRGLEGISFVLHHGGEELPVRVPLLGRHSVHTALAAAAVARVEGLSCQEIAIALQTASSFRLVATPGLRGSTIIDDTYNASPDSTLAALDLLAELEGRKIAVLGDMRELGPYEAEGHLRVGRRAAAVADLLIVVGEKGALIGREAAARGAQVIFASSREGAAAKLLDQLRAGDQVLVKGSRAMRMEEIVERVKAE